MTVVRLSALKWPSFETIIAAVNDIKDIADRKCNYNDRVSICSPPTPSRHPLIRRRYQLVVNRTTVYCTLRHRCTITFFLITHTRTHARARARELLADQTPSCSHTQCNVFLSFFVPSYLRQFRVHGAYILGVLGAHGHFRNSQMVGVYVSRGVERKL